MEILKYSVLRPISLIQSTVTYFTISLYSADEQKISVKLFNVRMQHTGQSIRCIAGVYADLPGIDTLICGIKWRRAVNKLRKW